MWHIKALISLEWKNWTGWNLLSFFPIWTTSKAIKCWKLGLFSFSAPAYFINPVNPSINYNRIAAFLSGRHRSRPKDRVQASFFFQEHPVWVRVRPVYAESTKPGLCSSSLLSASCLRLGTAHSWGTPGPFPFPSVLKFIKPLGVHKDETKDADNRSALSGK